MAKNKKITDAINHFLGGKWFLKNMKENVVFYVFLGVLAIFYIGNRYKVENLQKKKIAIEHEIKNLRIKSINFNAEKLKKSRITNIVEKLNEQEIKIDKPKTPPTKIVVKRRRKTN